MAQVPRRRADARPSGAAPSSTPRSLSSTPLPTVSTVPRASWPICAPTVSGCPARPWRPRCAARAWPGSARAGSRRPPRWSTSMRRAQGPGEAPVRHRASWTGCGPPTSPTCAPVQGWLYLCAVRDGCSRRVIGWAIDEHMRTDLVESALAMAVAMRGELADQVILHADRGCQYTSAQLARFAGEHNLVRSVGRTGVCWDNAAGRIILGHTKSRVLRPIPLADQGGRQARRRRLDRTGLQPPQTPLGPRYDQPGRLRKPTHSDGTSRLTLCPPNGVKPRTLMAVLRSLGEAVPDGSQVVQRGQGRPA